MNPLLPFALAALLAAPAIADPDMTPEEFFDAQDDCFDSREPEECIIARYRDATERQTTWLVNKFADDFEKNDQYGAANVLRSTYRAYAGLGRPGTGLELGLRYAERRHIE